MRKSHVQLSESDRESLQQIVRQQKVSVKVSRRAQALLVLDSGATLQKAAVLVGVNYNGVAQWRNRYQSEGLSFLEDRPRSGRPPVIDGFQRAKITALACSTSLQH